MTMPLSRAGRPSVSSSAVEAVDNLPSSLISPSSAGKSATAKEANH